MYLVSHLPHSYRYRSSTIPLIPIPFPMIAVFSHERVDQKALCVEVVCVAKGTLATLL